MWLAGQAFRHKQYGYKGVIIGWDARAKAPKEWFERMGVTQAEQLSPMYSVLVDTRDRDEVRPKPHPPTHHTRAYTITASNTHLCARYGSLAPGSGTGLNLCARPLLWWHGQVYRGCPSFRLLSVSPLCGVRVHLCVVGGGPTRSAGAQQNLRG